MAFPPLDIHVPATALHFFPFFPDFVQQNRRTVHVKGTVLAGRTVDDLHHCLRNHRSHRPRQHGLYDGGYSSCLFLRDTCKRLGKSFPQIPSGRAARSRPKRGRTFLQR